MYSVFFFYGSGDHLDLHVLTHAFPTRRSSDLAQSNVVEAKAAPPKGGFDFRGATWPGTSKSADKAASTNPEPAKIPVRDVPVARMPAIRRSEEHTSELQSLMRISYAVFCLKKKTQQRHNTPTTSIPTKH